MLTYVLIQVDEGLAFLYFVDSQHICMLICPSGKVRKYGTEHSYLNLSLYRLMITPPPQKKMMSMSSDQIISS